MHYKIYDCAINKNYYNQDKILTVHTFQRNIVVMGTVTPGEVLFNAVIKCLVHVSITFRILQADWSLTGTDRRHANPLHAPHS